MHYVWWCFLVAECHLKPQEACWVFFFVCTLFDKKTVEDLVGPNTEHVLYFLVVQWEISARRDPRRLHKELDEQNDVFRPSSSSDVCTRLYTNDVKFSKFDAGTTAILNID